MEFTKQEMNLLKRIANTGKWEQLIWEAVYLVPSIALIVFGTLGESKRSIFVGAGIFAAIRIMATLQQSRTFNVLKELCNKIYARIASEKIPDSGQPD
jgi:hypothetical protein